MNLCAEVSTIKKLMKGESLDDIINESRVII
jgi:hypothetical protein